MGVNISPGRGAGHELSGDKEFASSASRMTYGASEPTDAGAVAGPMPASGSPRQRGRQAFWSSFGHAWDGLEYVVATQRNIRIHLAAAVAALALGLLLQLTLVEFALILLTILAVLSAELFNTAVESLVDLVTDDYHEVACAAKDVAAGAVLLCAIFAVIIGCAVYGPHVWTLLFGLHGN